VTEEQLAKLCGKYGQVSSCQIKQTPDRQSLGKALVTFANKDDACITMEKPYFESELGLNVKIEFY
jgi:RNA recognition motif-containing protein